MRAIVMYSRHEAGQREKAQAIAQSMGAYASAVDVVDAYGNDLGNALLTLLRPREFPAVIFVQDHLAGSALAENDHLQAAVAEQHDIAEREYRKNPGSGHLKAQLDSVKEEGREEIRKVVKEADQDGTIEGKAKEKLIEKGVLK